MVTSAMAWVTDTLVVAARVSSPGELDAAYRELQAHLDRHVAVAAALVDRVDAAEVEAVVTAAGREIRDLLRIMAVHPGTRRALGDEVVSWGERLSSFLLAAVLRAWDLPARWVDARACIRTNEEHGRAAPFMERTVEETRRTLPPLFTVGEVPVLGGFIGSAETGATTTLGRGGSDYTAALTGAALEAREIQIWTDVTGFLTADPRVVPHARRIKRMSYEEADGRTTALATGANPPWNGVAYHRGAFYVAEGGHREGGRILRIGMNGTITPLVQGLPSLGDHHTNGPAIGPDGRLYFAQGTATNSGVVGEDNHQFGWLPRNPGFHDVPCRDVTLTGENFTTGNPLTPDEADRATTGAFVPFGTPTVRGQTIRGRVPCSGAVMRIPLAGGTPEVVAWGFRNPFGIAWSPEGRLYVSDNQYDDRGSRPVWGGGDLLWSVEPGSWYGWPDFHGGRALSDADQYKPPGKPRPAFLLAEHPNPPPRPAAILGVHSSSNGFDFSRSAAFGHAGEAFVAQFGDMAPGVGKVLSPVGFKVVRVEVATGVVHDFAVNRGSAHGPASRIGGGGLERPIAVRFNPSGDALYLVDFGVMTMGPRGPEPRAGTGVLWRITRTGGGVR